MTATHTTVTIDPEIELRAAQSVIRELVADNERLKAALQTIANCDTIGGVSSGERKGLQRAATLARALKELGE